MTIPCRPPVPCPAIQPVESDCENVNHDAVLSRGGVAGGDDVMSAALLQLHIPAQSWWAASSFDFELGSRVTTAKTDALREAAIRTALAPLVTCGLMEQPRIRIVETVGGRVIEIEAGDRPLFGVKI